MPGLNFGFTASVLKNSLEGASLANSAIANNIANANTPGYQRFDVAYQQALAAMEPTPPDPNQLALTVDQPNMIEINGEIPAQPFSVTPTRSADPTEMRVDGSNVDLDQEMALLTQNSSYQQSMAQFLTSQYTRLRSAIETRA